MEDNFLKGSRENKSTSKVAKEMFESIEKFARYGFNKSHSAAYAVISYQTAYLKAHYTVEYMCALLSSTSDQDDIIKYVNDARANGIEILPPDINNSGYDFSIEDSSIRFGLNAIKASAERRSRIDHRRAEGRRRLLFARGFLR
jgi:DNA polymerase-3 subunit alpha